MRGFEGFNPEYLALREGKGDRVAELPKSRYLPFRPQKISERLIQLLWKNLLFNNSSMKTTNGVPVIVIKPGRFNRKEGPDFKNGVFILNGKKMAGDVEIHLHAREWYEHKHHTSPHYNRTLLHVFLYRSEGTLPAANRKGKILHEVELGLYLRHSLDELQKEMEYGVSPISGRPDSTPCRKVLSIIDVEAVTWLLDMVGEGRMLIKSNRLIDRMESTPQEQLLYEVMFECLGYSNFKNQFRTLAENIPRKTLLEIIKRNPSRASHLTAQAVLFPLSGLGKSVQLTAADTELKELLAEYKQVDSPGLQPVFDLSDWAFSGCRPANFPHRRIAAFSHLATELTDVAFYQKLISSFSDEKDETVSRKYVLRIIGIFSAISDPFWNYRYNFNRRTRLPKKLIGRDRAISMLVDCIIPFYLAISRSMHDLKTEKWLLAAYYATPKPSSNAVIDFMVRNMFGKENSRYIKSVRHQQALIQLHNDFCYRAPSGCGECPLPDYLNRFIGK